MVFTNFFSVHSLFEWNTENLLSFKLSKCVALQHLSSSMSPNIVYNLNKSELQVLFQHKDIGILFSANLS